MKHNSVCIKKNSLIQGKDLEEPEQPGEHFFMKNGLVNWHKLSILQLCEPDLFFFAIVVMYSLQQLFQVESGLILDVVQKGEKGLAYSFNC